uniref:Uncharacterized protein n=1 Tax=viral metagenome TaxID=1070528 RepID=A0A6C0H462_9ZZZZ
MTLHFICVYYIVQTTLFLYNISIFYKQNNNILFLNKIITYYINDRLER